MTAIHLVRTAKESSGVTPATGRVLGKAIGAPTRYDTSAESTGACSGGGGLLLAQPAQSIVKRIGRHSHHRDDANRGITKRREADSRRIARLPVWPWDAVNAI